MKTAAALALACTALYGAEKSTFSHKDHAALKLPCVYCHAGSAANARAGFPDAARCQTCHTGDAIGKFPKRRVYKVRDFVFFSHAAHAKAVCADCHGAVYEQAVLTQARPVTMKACVDCHRERQASQSCSICHELGQ